MKAKVADTCFVIAPDTRREVADVNQGEIYVNPWGEDPPDYGVASRVFDRFRMRPEDVEPGGDWKKLSGVLSDRVRLSVTAVIPPMLVLSGEEISIGTFGRDDIERVLVYADAVVPAG